jgi:hypothetical protein
MWAFQYKHGDKPLAGFTIQRAAGRGGFGEVYYAVSDSGREVALKVVTGYEQIELRGISQCMNLKNPHLVSIFDVKYNDQGRPFVIMEFVAGPSLRQLLDESPGGLGAQKSAFFLREIGKGLTFLHDCGIVHRDLKPGNIFYESGYVKIGDYGLSKAIEPTQHSGQTITVGTVHYMAPEIGGGRYDKSIDIYAMGAVLYEMLTGQPPFLGASAGEILFKHLSAEPDFTNIEEPFRAVIRKAMAKDPADRYQSIQEMVEAVFGAEHIQQSVSCFSPDSLSMIAQRVAHRVAVGGGSATPPPIPRGAAVAAAAPAGDRLGQMFDRVGDRLGAFGNRVADLGVHALPRHARRQSGDEPAEEIGDPLTDPLSQRQRRVLALIMLLVTAGAAAVLSPIGRTNDGHFFTFWAVILSGIGATLGTLLAGHRILPQMTSDSGFLRRLASGGTAAGLLMLFGLPVIGAANGADAERLALTALGALIALMLIPPPDLSPSRPERVAFGPAVGAAALGFVAWIFTHGNFGLLVALLAGSHLLAQVLSPWDPFAARRKLGLPGDSSGAPAPQPANRGRPFPPPHHPDAPTMAWPPAPPAAAHAAAHAAAWAEYAGDAAAGNVRRPALRPVPVSFRYLWLLMVVLFIPAGIGLVIGGNSPGANGGETVGLTSFGVGLLALGALAIAKVWQSAYTTKWRYAGRYFAAWVCFQVMLFPAIALGEMHLHGAEEAFSIVLLLSALLLIPIFLFVRFSSAGPTTYAEPPAPPAPPVPPVPPEAPGFGAGPARPAAVDRRTQRRLNRRARWTEGRAWRVHGPPFHVRVINFFRNLVVGTSITTLLIVGTAAALYLAFDIPGMLAAGIPDKDIPRQMTRNFGFAQWPQFLRAIGQVVGWGSLLLAALVLIVSRRGTYGFHILRGAAGVGVFAASFFVLDRAMTGRWSTIAPPASQALTIDERAVVVSDGAHPQRWINHPPGSPPNDEDANRVASAFEQYFNQSNTGMIPVAGGVALFGLILICWPARRARGMTDAPVDDIAQPATAEHA